MSLNYIILEIHFNNELSGQVQSTYSFEVSMFQS